MNIKPFTTFISSHFAKILSVFFFILLSAAYVQTFAVFAPGESLSPNCQPGDAGCYVVFGLDGNSSFVVGGAVSASTSGYSNFLGFSTGLGAANASYSNLFGYKAGMQFSGNDIGSNNIIIGTNISLPDSTANAINIGGVLFGTGTYNTTTGNPSVIPSVSGKIGIGIVNPSVALDVAGSLRIRGLAPTIVTIGDAGNLQATQTCADGCNYQANSWNHNYKVYAYKDTINGRIYSVNPLTLPSDFVDDGSANNYDITLSWDPVSGADGYRILKFDPNYNGYDYDAGYDTTSTSIVDDGCGSVCYDGGSVDITPTSISVASGFSQVDEPVLLSGASNYLNFDTIIGDSGFGIRNNAGVMEFKNTGGNWTGLVGALSAANSSTNGFLSSSDWNTFNNKTTLPDQTGNAGKYLTTNGNFISWSDIAASFKFTNSNNAVVSNSASVTGVGNILMDPNFFATLSGNNNVVLGGSAGSRLSSGSDNILLGSTTCTNGNQNIYFNANAYHGSCVVTGTGSNNIAIGSGIDVVDPNGNNQLNIGGVIVATGLGSSQPSPGTGFTSLTNPRVGIAVQSNPNHTLDVNGNIGIATSGYINFDSNDGSSGYGIRDNGGIVQYKNSGGAWANFETALTFSTGLTRSTNIITSNLSVGISGGQSVVGGTASGDALTLSSTSNATKGKILFGTSGYDEVNNMLGIGTASASFKTHVVSNSTDFSANTYGITNQFNADVANGSRLAFYKSRGTAASPTALNSSDVIGSLQFFGYDGTGYFNQAAFNIDASQAWGSTAHGTQIRLNTTPNGSTTSAERIRILNSGFVGIGTTAPGVLLSVGSGSTTDGNVFRVQDANGTCDHNPGSASEVVTCTSDARLKQNIINANPALPDLLKFSIKQYDAMSDGTHYNYGVLAQDVLDIEPGMVHTREDGFYGVEEVSSWKIVKAIQEMHLTIADLSSLDTTKATSLGSLVKGFLADAANGLQKLFVGEVTTKNLCVADDSGARTCITKAQLDALLSTTNIQSMPAPTVVVPPDTATPVTSEVSVIPVQTGETQVVLTVPDTASTTPVVTSSTAPTETPSE